MIKYLRDNIREHFVTWHKKILNGLQKVITIKN